MRNAELVKVYFEVFFENHQFEKLYDIFAGELIFIGPFICSNTASEYINALKKDPPVNCSYEIIHQFEQQNKINVLYKFKSAEVEAWMSQLFEIEDGRIAKIILIFDSALFRQK